MQKRFMALCVLVAGCGAGPQPDDAAVAAIRANIQASVAAHAAGDAARWAALYEPDAVLMPEGSPAVTGQDAIRSWIADFYAANRFTVSIDVQEINVAGEWAFSRDAFNGIITPRNGGAAVPMVGKEIVIWRRQADGSWKAARAIFNSNAAAAAAPQ